MTTSLRIIPSADAVFNDLKPLLAASYDAFEQGTFEARDYFQRIKKDIDPYVFAHLSRYHAREVLTAKGYSASGIENLPELMLKPLSNSGIYLAYLHYRVRVMKFKREVPHPGRSQSRQRLYEQDWEQLRLDFPDIDDPRDCLGLLLLWRVDESYGLKSFSLACPQGAGTARDSVRLYWNKPIPMEYLQNILIAPPPEQPSELEDLPLEENVEIEIDKDFEE